MSCQPEVPSESLQPSVPTSARFWNACLGGKENFAVDQELLERMMAVFPGVRGIAQASRNFLATSVSFLVGRGVTQFLDLGAGLPIEPNTHQLAQRHDPTARIVYVDQDPIVLAHARALLTGTAEGATDYLDADFYDRERVLEQASRTLDLSTPVGVLWLSTLGHVDPGQAPDLVRNYLGALPEGSYLALCDTLVEEEVDDSTLHDTYTSTGTQPYTVRHRRDFDALTEGNTLVWPLQALPDDHGEVTAQHGLILRS